MATNPFNVEFNYFHENSLDYKNKLCQWILSNKKGYIAHLKRNHSKLIDYLNSNFIQLNQHSLSEKLYWFIYQINEFPMCKTCGKHPTKFRSFDAGYASWCSNKCAQMDESIKQKIVSTKISRFGCANNSQTDEFKAHISNICKNRTIEQKRQILVKKESTCTNIYGTKHPMQNILLRQHVSQVNKSKSNIIMEKSKQGCLNKHGCEYTGQIPSKISSTLETMNIKYGGHVLARSGSGKRIIEELRGIKLSQIRSRKYILAETYDGQFYTYRNSMNIDKSQYKTIMVFDSKLEINLYVYCIQNNINVEYHPNIEISYKYDDQYYIYEPDFKINDKLIEVKGDMFFRINESTSMEEMYCPWGRKKLGEEKWKWLCGKFEAKHQCMLSNNVMILRQHDIKDISCLQQKLLDV